MKIYCKALEFGKKEDFGRNWDNFKIFVSERKQFRKIAHQGSIFNQFFLVQFLGPYV